MRSIRPRFPSRRLGALFTLALAGAVVLAACGGSSQQPAAKPAAPAQPSAPAAQPAPAAAKPAAPAQATPAPSQPLEKFDWTLGFTSTLDTFAIEFGKNKGLFKKHGFDLNTVLFRGGGAAVQALAADQGQIASVGVVPASQGISKGLPIKMVAMTVNPLLEAILVPKGSAIKKPEDIRGKKFGIAGRGTLTEMEARYAASLGKLGPNDYTLVDMGSSDGLMGALLSGQIDVTVMYGVPIYQLLADGKAEVLIDLQKVAPRASNEVIIVTDKFLKAQPDKIRRLLRVYFEIVDYMKAKPDEVIQGLSTDWKVEPKLAKAYYDATIGAQSLDGVFDLEGVKWVRDRILDLKLVPSMPEPKDLVHTEFVPVKR